MEKETKKIKIPGMVTVKKFSEILNLPISAVITELMKNGILANINETIDFETASIVALDLGYEAEEETAEIEGKMTLEALLEILKKEKEEKTNRSMQLVENITNFYPDSVDKEYPNMACGSWIATENGIFSSETSKARELVCHHPIMPIRRLKNIETGEEEYVYTNISSKSRLGRFKIYDKVNDYLLEAYGRYNKMVKEMKVMSAFYTDSPYPKKAKKKAK